MERCVEFLVTAPPCVIHEDEHLLVVNKPSGLNTHSPAPFAGEGIYDWLRHRERRWANLSIIQRLDKDTSGIIVFGKTQLANQSLSLAFEQRKVCKTYVLLSDRLPKKAGKIRVRSTLVRVGERYVSRPLHQGAPLAETWFRAADPSELMFGPMAPRNGREVSVILAEPATGRTHQIRVHAAESGFPILGDVFYGGTAAARVFLHAWKVCFHHPATGEEVSYRAPIEFEKEPSHLLRQAVIAPAETDAYRIYNGAADGAPNWYVDRFGAFLLSQGPAPLGGEHLRVLSRLNVAHGTQGVLHKILSKHVRGSAPAAVSPQPALGSPPPERFQILENGLRFEMSFAEGYSTGLFLDQRDNRRRLLTGHIAAGFDLGPNLSLLNTFAYTCGFSVCAAKAGMATTSLDLSRKYLDWGKRNFELNNISTDGHDFVYGDTFDWLKRWSKKQRQFDVIVLDPPTFSDSKASGTFRAEKDYPALVKSALTVLKPGGVLLASSNAESWPAEDFVSVVGSAIKATGREVLQSHYVPQPIDFPISRERPAYLKTLWSRVS